MDRILSYGISKEDIGSILRTILLFLESLNFKQTPLILQQESYDLGYSESSDKIFVITPSTADVQAGCASKINQTEFGFDSDDKSFVLESSVCEISEKQTDAQKPVLVYFTDSKHFYGHSSDENIYSTTEQKHHGKTAPVFTSLRKDKATNTENNNITRKESLHSVYENSWNRKGSAKLNQPEMIQKNTRFTNSNYQGDVLHEEYSNKEYTDLQHNLVMLQDEHEKLMGVAAELLSALQTSIVGQSQKFNNLLEKCKEVYPDISKLINKEDNSFAKRINLRNEEKEFTAQNANFRDGKLPKEETVFRPFTRQNEEELSNNKSEGFESKIEHDIANKNNSLTKNERMLSFFVNVDYRKVKRDLLEGNIEKRMLILQALRWRITKSSPEGRDKVINSFTKHDLLDLYSGNMQLKLLESLYCPKQLQTPHQLQESVARLVNTFASLKLGRDYLCQDDRLLLNLLLPLILNPNSFNIKLNSTARDMLLATLQKLSLRNRQRQHMISSGLVEHLVMFLNDNHLTVSGYCLEYCSALLMNLCLHKEARERCSVKASEVVHLLIKLLKCKNADCAPYVNGAMYSLLGNPKINQEARKMQLKKFVRQHIVDCMSDENLKQLEFIITAHLEGEINQPEEVDLGAEGEDEVDLIEEELDENDTVQNPINGEAVLYEYRLEHDQDLETGARLSFLNRLATPRQRPTSYKSDGTDRNTIDLPHPSRCSMESVENTRARTIHENTANATEPSVVDDGYSRRCFSPSSPDESFSEVTKQFYHKPSAKRGIFDRKKVKFTKNYSYLKNTTIERKTTKCKTAATSTNCYKGCYNTPQVNSQPRKNTEQGTNTEGAFDDHGESNKYHCSCFEMMKAYLENNNISDKNAKIECERLNNVPNVSNGISHLPTRKKLNRDKSMDRENGEYVTNNEHQNLNGSYKTVFQSRPKIIRTPQNNKFI